MKIGIDARKIRDFGIGNYIKQLLTYIPCYDRENEYYIFHYPEDTSFIPQNGSNISLIADSSPKYSVKELLGLPIKMATQRLDLFHAPHYTLPPIRPCKGVVTIHDVIHLRFPEYLPHPAAYYYAKGMMWAAAKSAKKVLTVSECSKQDIMACLGVPEQKIEVIYNGIEPRREAIEDIRNPASRERLRQQLGISRKYLLFLSNFMPHKNFDTLIKAYSLLKHRDKLDACLVIAGKNDKLRVQLEELIEQEQLSEDVILTGFVAPELTPALYANAELFVYPSLYEGFGLQALEAMNYDTPVTISNASSLPEIAGNAALAFDPASSDEMAAVILKILNDPGLRKSLVEKGRKRVQDFSWRTAVERTVEVYRGILGARDRDSENSLPPL